MPFLTIGYGSAMSQVRSVKEFDAGKSQLESLRAVLRSDAIGWQRVVEVVLDYVGLDLVLSVATDPNLSIESANNSFGIQLGHHSLVDFIASPQADNGLNIKWDVWVEHVKAAVLAERFSIKTKTLSPKQLLNLDKQITDHLGRFASSGPEWHSTRASIEEARHNMVAARVSGEARKHRDKARKLVENLHKLNNRFDEVSDDLLQTQLSLQEMTTNRNNLLQDVDLLKNEIQAAHERHLELEAHFLLRHQQEVNDKESALVSLEKSHRDEIDGLQTQVNSLNSDILRQNEQILELEYLVADKAIIANDLKKSVAESQYLQAEISKLNIERELLLDECHANQHEINEYKSKTHLLEDKISSLTCDLESHLFDLSNAKDAEKSTHERNNKLSAEIQSLRQYLNCNPNESKRMAYLCEVAESQRDNISGELEKVKDEVTYYRRRLSHAEAVIIDGRGINENSKAALLHDDYSVLKAEYKDLSDELSYTNSALSHSLQHIDTLNERVHIKNIELQGVRSSNDELKQQIEHLEQMLGEDTLARIELYKTQVNVLKNHRNSLNRSLQSKQENTRHLINVIERAKVRLKHFQNRANNNALRVSRVIIGLREERSNTLKQKRELNKFRVRVAVLLSFIFYMSSQIVIQNDLRPAIDLAKETYIAVEQKLVNALL